ncbi:hypothetical protein CSPHI_00695 [Corynebacterium sphenisci DSM 44792]|uniref:VWFA domain-containing protein n=1 Tax=Corynebacterium sphenisci DSM 44792 TaxID=1437874 RepID=A0A1L7CVI0_9CORY|nr:vWA domain-containing protein [Corynebacterium sphenisci]APT89853.1 hypothetical protein CSPHI_00695 [Corynebacterium sphenisci DSM 44792]
MTPSTGTPRPRLAAAATALLLALAAPPPAQAQPPADDPEATTSPTPTEDPIPPTEDPEDGTPTEDPGDGTPTEDPGDGTPTEDPGAGAPGEDDEDPGDPGGTIGWDNGTGDDPGDQDPPPRPAPPRPGPAPQPALPIPDGPGGYAPDVPAPGPGDVLPPVNQEVVDGVVVTEERDPEVPDDADLGTVYGPRPDMGGPLPAEIPRNPDRQADKVPPEWFGEAPEGNPKPHSTCGGSVALVLDVSDSAGERGIEAFKRAAKAAVDVLAGTSASVGVYDFGTKAPANPKVAGGPFPVADEGDVAKLKDRIDRIGAGEPGGTNWEGGLAQVPAQTYDVLYLLTDGAPTTNNVRTGGDFGVAPHAADLSAAVAAANVLKSTGTRIVPVLVDADEDPVYFVNDDIPLFSAKVREPEVEGIYLAQQGEGPAFIGRHDGTAPNPYPGGVGPGPAPVDPVTGEILGEAAEPPRYDDEPEAWSVNPEAPRYPLQMARDVSSYGAPVAVQSYAEVATALREEIDAGCTGAAAAAVDATATSSPTRRALPWIAGGVAAVLVAAATAVALIRRRRRRELMG